jgi:tripartite-type tricarboxylate transporter receptor subunit TctC
MFGIGPICRGIAVCILGLTATAQPAAGQTADIYPARAIRIIVPFSAGGTSDVLARLIGHKLGAALRQNVIVDNRPGANGNLGTDVVAKSPPDGYTLVLVADGTVAINPGLFAKPPYDSEKDLAPITRVASVPLILVAHPTLKADSLSALIALSKTADLNFSSAGLGSTGHLAGELIKVRTGLRMTHVAYRGGGQAVNDVVSGHVPLLITALVTAASFMEAGQLKPIAVTSANRIPGVSSVPTMIEAGISDFDVSSWYAIMAPGGTPKSIVEKLHGELVKALADPELKSKLEALGAFPIGDSPDEFAKVLHSDLARWKRVIRDANLNIQ